MRTDRLQLTGTFALYRNGRAVEIPRSAQRVLAFLAVCGAPVGKSSVAGVLWPEVAERRALADLRSALWRLGPHARLVVVDRESMALAPGVSTDIADLHRLVDSVGTGSDVIGSLRQLVEAREVLPDWDEAWLEAERSQLRELRLSALEIGAAQLIRDGNLAPALRPVLAAIAGDPFRESARLLFLRILLAQGNRVAALRQVEDYERLLREELNLGPSQALRRLLSLETQAPPR